MKFRKERKAPSFFPKLIAVAVFSAYAAGASAIEPFTVRDIRVEGIQRTEAGTVFNYLPVRVGDLFNDEKAAAAIKALYATGFFKDVRIEAECGHCAIGHRHLPRPDHGIPHAQPADGAITDGDEKGLVRDRRESQYPRHGIGDTDL